MSHGEFSWNLLSSCTCSCPSCMSCLGTMVEKSLAAMWFLSFRTWKEALLLKNHIDKLSCWRGPWQLAYSNLLGGEFFKNIEYWYHWEPFLSYEKKNLSNMFMYKMLCICKFIWNFAQICPCDLILFFAFTRKLHSAF